MPKDEPVIQPAPIGIPVTQSEQIMPEVSTPKVEEPVAPQVEKKSENPNVYAQNKNDFIDINKLNEVKTPVTSALEGLNIVENKSDIFSDNTIKVEDKKEENMIEVPNKKAKEPAPFNLSKLKLATAIKLAKDTLDDMITAGYNATMEEVDGLTDYQIVIKIEK